METWQKWVIKSFWKQLSDRVPSILFVNYIFKKLSTFSTFLWYWQAFKTELNEENNHKKIMKYFYYNIYYYSKNMTNVKDYITKNSGKIVIITFSKQVHLYKLTILHVNWFPWSEKVMAWCFPSHWMLEVSTCFMLSCLVETEEEHFK